MRKLTFLAAMFMLTNFAFAGGLLTNTNQSAQFIRMMSRNASLDIDAVYYNPAGLTKLQDGWHFGVYSQTIFQDKTVECGFPLLNEPSYLGTVEVPVFPTAFAVYKKEKWAFSFGFGPNAGGGSAEFERGLPSFEIPISKVVPGLAGLSQISPALSVTGYNADLYFTGSSIFWGFQLGATYEINEMLSVYGGVRYMPAKNVYQGSIKNIQLEVGGNMTPAPAFLTQAAGVVNGVATASYGVATSLQPIVAGGGGSYTLAQVQQAGYISTAQKALMEGGLLKMGYTQAQVDAMPVTTVQGSYTASGNVLTATAATLTGTSAQLGDKEVDTEQTGTGFTPIIGINISPNEDWNIGIKYEHKTKLTLKNKTTVDDLGLFPNDAESASDVPAILGIGVGYKGMDWLEAQVSYTQYFNKSVDWGMNVRDASSWKSVDPSKIRKREIEKNGYEIGLGLQFNLSEKFAVSVGGLMGDMGVAPSYQSDFSYSNPSTTLGGGIMWKLSEKLTLDAGISNTFYKDQTVNFADPVVPSYNDVYGKTALTFAAGLSYSIF
jgi:long-chain fatty acid transport protein